MPQNKRRIPTISEERINDSPSNTGVGYSGKDRYAHSFITGKEPVKPLTLRVPVSMHDRLREIAFKEDKKITHIILEAINKHIKND